MHEMSNGDDNFLLVESKDLRIELTSCRMKILQGDFLFGRLSAKDMTCLFIPIQRHTL